MITQTIASPTTITSLIIMPKSSKSAADSTDTAIEELRALLSEAESALGSAGGDQADDKIDQLRKRLRSALDNIRPKIDEWKNIVQDQAERADEYAHKHPYYVAGAAALAGVAAGLIFARGCRR